MMKRGPSTSTHYTHYDPVSGYIHKFRLDGSTDAGEREDAGPTQRTAGLPLLVASSIAVCLLLIIGVLTL